MYKNAVNLIGFVGKDAEVKAAQDNSTNFTVLSLATKESWKNKRTNGNRAPSGIAFWFSASSEISLPRSPKALTSK
jgi:single-stranded DNA-binding protein